MEVTVQTCQACGARVLENFVLRQSGERPVVIARCSVCQELVARYELSGYYHHGKGFEAWLRTLAVYTESVIDLQETFASLKERAQHELSEALSILGSQDPGQPGEGDQGK